MRETRVPAAYTVTEAAAAYSVSPQVIRAAIRNGALAARVIGEGDKRLHARIGVDDLAAWFDALPQA